MKNKLKQFREEAKMTQEELASNSNVSRNTISAIETKENVNVTYDIMEKLSVALGKKVSNVFFED